MSSGIEYTVLKNLKRPQLVAVRRTSITTIIIIITIFVIAGTVALTLSAAGFRTKKTENLCDKTITIIKIYTALESLKFKSA